MDELPQQDFEALQERMLTRLRNWPDGQIISSVQEFIETTKIEERQKLLFIGELQITGIKCNDADFKSLIREFKAKDKD